MKKKMFLLQKVLQKMFRVQLNIAACCTVHQKEKENKWGAFQRRYTRTKWGTQQTIRILGHEDSIRAVTQVTEKQSKVNKAAGLFGSKWVSTVWQNNEVFCPDYRFFFFSQLWKQSCYAATYTWLRLHYKLTCICLKPTTVLLSSPRCIFSTC